MPGWRVLTSDGSEIGHVARVLRPVADGQACLVLSRRRAGRREDASVVIAGDDVVIEADAVRLRQVARADLGTTGWMRAARYADERPPSRLDGERPATAPLPCMPGAGGTRRD